MTLTQIMKTFKGEHINFYRKKSQFVMGFITSTGMVEFACLIKTEDLTARDWTVGLSPMRGEEEV